MKIKYITIVFAAVLSGFIISCDNFLEEEANGTLTPSTFFQNESEANLALNGLQGRMTGPSNYGHCGTDIGTSGRDLIAGGWVAYFYQHDASTAYVSTNWSSQYAGVRDANLVLSGIEASSLSDEVKGSTRAQTLFYRAWFYFELTTSYGDVPYWRDEIDMEVVAPLGMTSADTIQEEMIADLEEAINSGYMSTDTWSGNGGRPTVWAARMLKAHYHIWMEQWAEAKAELVEITTNSPHSLADSYGEKYKEGNELHNEVIFGREYLADVQSNGAYQNQSHPNANGENTDANSVFSEQGIYTRSSLFVTRWSFANSYDAADTRKAYNCWGTDSLDDGTAVTFNWVYIPKLMACALPHSDPLWVETLAANQSSAPRRFFVLADAYLLLAEAEFMLNGSTVEALAAINKVRERAGVDILTSLTIENIQQERAWELVAEGFFGRKKDLIRWGVLEEVVMGLPAKERAAGVYELGVSRSMDDSTQIADAPYGRYRVLPVPAEEILVSQDIGGGLEQYDIWID